MRAAVAAAMLTLVTLSACASRDPVVIDEPCPKRLPPHTCLSPDPAYGLPPSHPEAAIPDTAGEAEADRRNARYEWGECARWARAVEEAHAICTE